MAVNLIEPDFTKIEVAKQRIRDVWMYREVDHIPVGVRITSKWGNSRRSIIESDELQYQVNKHNLERSLRCLPDDYIPYARVWFGYMTIATMFGSSIHWTDDPDQPPGVLSPLITDMDQVFNLEKPGIDTGTMPDNLRLQRVFVEDFPPWVHLTGFDLGGPLNNCRDLVETSLLYTAMVEQPDALHHLLDLLTQVQIDCYAATEAVSGGLDRMTCIDMAQIWAPEGNKGFVSDDICSTISPMMFDKFSKPYNNRLYARWHGGLLHNCGPHPAASCYLDHTPPINGINCSYQYTREDFSKLREAFSGRGIVQAMFDNGETAEDMIAGFRDMMECFTPDVVAVPMCAVDDAWNDDDITALYWEMRKISEEYAANMNWRSDVNR